MPRVRQRFAYANSFPSLNVIHDGGLPPYSSHRPVVFEPVRRLPVSRHSRVNPITFLFGPLSPSFSKPAISESRARNEWHQALLVEIVDELVRNSDSLKDRLSHIRAGEHCRPAATIDEAHALLTGMSLLSNGLRPVRARMFT